MNWNIIVIIISLLLASFMVWREATRANKLHLGWRITAALVAVIALACILLPISYSGEITLTGNNDALLVTTGFNADSLGSYQNDRVFTNDKAVLKSYPKAKFISISELKTDSPAITRLHILGYGLNDDELQQLDSIPVAFHPVKAPGGISHISWNSKLKEGEQLRIQGTYDNISGNPVKLILKGLNTELDTASIPAKTNRQFELNTIPKHSSRAVYSLLALSGTDTLANEVIPVEIEPVKPLKILILTASPDFETRFLKNWLSENGYGVAIRSAISKDKFVKEYVNTESLPLDHISASVLDKFDVVLGDLSILKSLNADEGAVLKQEVSQKGLGVIVRADSSSKATSWLQSSFPVDRITTKDQVISTFSIQGKKSLSSKLKIDPDYIRPQNGTQPLVNDGKAHVVVSSAQYGAGRLVFSTLINTFNWALSGNKSDYEAFWSLLIGKAARKETVMEQWSVTSVIPVVNTPVNLQLETASQPVQINADQSSVSPLQNPTIPFEWNSIYWPSTPGWHQAKQSNNVAAWWYAYPSDAWSSVRATKKLNDTRQYALNNSKTGAETKSLHQKVQIPVSKLYFYILLLAALTYLWVENKLV